MSIPRWYVHARVHEGRGLLRGVRTLRARRARSRVRRAARPGRKIPTLVKLFIFSSSTNRNIWLGIKAGRWAVAPTDTKRKRELVTKSLGMPVGSRGVFWSSEEHCFTAPFIVCSSPDPSKEVTDIWPETWILPFAINPLGTLRKRLPRAEAARILPFLRNQQWTNIAHIANLNALVSFVPTEVSERDWEVLLARLSG